MPGGLPGGGMLNFRIDRRITSTPGKVRSKFKMFHLSKAKDAQNQDSADICGGNQRLSASENRVAMENRN